MLRVPLVHPFGCHVYSPCKGSGGGSASDTGADVERKVRCPKRAAKLTGADGTWSPAEQMMQISVFPFSD